MVDPVRFEAQLRYLKKKYNIISIHQVIDHLTTKVPLPNSSLLLTFDDGDISVLENGFPLLKKHDCPAVLFVITGLINTNENFWWNLVIHQRSQEGKSLSEVKDELNYLKIIENKDRLKALEDFTRVSRLQLTTFDLQNLRDNGIFIGNHSHSHPMFDRCTADELRHELEKTKSFFEGEGFTGYEIFAYPNGNYDKTAEKILIEKGIKLAFLFDHKLNSKDMDPLRISRIRTNADMEVDELKAKASGLHSFLYRKKKANDKHW
ncbi:polysaccharide deacetylase family protein [Salinimicrobium oceani]|uniref:Polysaccharide deacetylase family protein n=1 Tax=Salinimicrobium oceani TaxID=2722702 RepID=A0ABX1D408_9FLAO|nr:polysaccharide deacetylase family protein [Salinimicrobium oceani]NJW53438.1 polysaccharide deacetylase family protein [Salinimicrobium oceani]